MTWVKSTTNVNIRLGPGIDYDVLGELPEGYTVEVAGEIDDGFRPIILWVSDQYLVEVAEEEEEAVVKPADSEPAWLTIAKSQIGVKEIAGGQDNPQVVAYHQTCTLKATDDETPWCSAFVNWCVTQAGLKGTNSAAAISWMDWGQKVSSENVKPGDIVVFSRTGGNHVAFYIGMSGASIKVLGGNQSDEVNIATYSTDRVIGIRRPNA